MLLIWQWPVLEHLPCLIVPLPQTRNLQNLQGLPFTWGHLLYSSKVNST